MPVQDARLPLRFGPITTRRPGEAVLFEGTGVTPAPSQAISPRPSGHMAGCACCRPRSAVAVALATLFRSRATGTDFGAVLADVSPVTETAVRAALSEDLFAAARFRLADA